MVTMDDIVNFILDMVNNINLDMATVNIDIMDNRATVKMDIMGDIHNIILDMGNNINLDMAAVDIDIMDMVKNIIMDMATINIDIKDMASKIILDILDIEIMDMATVNINCITVLFFLNFVTDDFFIEVLFVMLRSLWTFFVLVFLSITIS